MFTNPEKNLKAFGLRDDMIVADLGAGTGFYSIAAAKMVPRGKVYAIEVLKDFLITIKEKAKDAHLKNMAFLWGNIEKIGGTGLKNGIVDAVLASNVLFQVENKDKFIEEIKRILKPAGRVLLIDWSVPLAKTEANLKRKISAQEARTIFEKKGFIFEREIDAGSNHYGIIFKK